MESQEPHRAVAFESSPTPTDAKDIEGLPMRPSRLRPNADVPDELYPAPSPSSPPSLSITACLLPHRMPRDRPRLHPVFWIELHRRSRCLVHCPTCAEIERLITPTFDTRMPDLPLQRMAESCCRGAQSVHAHQVCMIRHIFLDLASALPMSRCRPPSSVPDSAVHHKDVSRMLSRGRRTGSSTIISATPSRDGHSSCI